MIPISLAIIYYFKAPKDSLKLFLWGWLTVALVSFINCPLAPQVKGYVLSIARYVEKAPLYMAVLRIFVHNFVVYTLCMLLGRAYYGFTLAVTSIVARELAHSYPIQVVLGAHTILEIYAYSLATTRSKRKLVEGIVYLMIAAVVETIAIRF